MKRSAKNVIIWQGHWKPQDCKDNPDCLFVFGDNMQEVGKGGQAVIRDEPNSTGIWTKVRPSMDEDAFFENEEEAFRALSYKLNQLEHDIVWGEIHRHTSTVVFSENGYGNGLSKLDQMYPNAYDYLCTRIRYMTRFFGGETELNKLHHKKT